jgi:DNA (cytosine-5)-methyltransferase 1
MSNIYDLISIDDNNLYIRIKQATKQGYALMRSGGVADLAYPSSTLRRGRVQGYGQICPTLTTDCSLYKIERTDSMNTEDWQIRKLTPTECFRLQGFTDEDVEKCRAVGVSNSQLYKQAGNSITTNVIELLAEHLYKAQIDNSHKCTDELYYVGRPKKRKLF